MLPITLSVALLVAFPGVPGQCGHHRVRQECSACDDEGLAVARQIDRLNSDGWIARRKAARALRGFDWKSHPESAEALVEALLHDDCGLVRQEAAESLAKMRPCLPGVHEAVAEAASHDSALLARHWAKKALNAIKGACVEPCGLCEPADSIVDPSEWRDAEGRVVPGDPRVTPLVPVVPLPRGTNGTSPFDRGESPPLPSLDPADETTPEPGNGPVLESPSLLAPLGSASRSPGLRTPR